MQACSIVHVWVHWDAANEPISSGGRVHPNGDPVGLATEAEIRTKMTLTLEFSKEI